MDFNNSTTNSLPGHLNSGKESPIYFLIYLGFLIFCPLFYIIYRFVKLFCFRANSSTAMRLPSTADPHGDNSNGVYVIGIDVIEGIIWNSEMTVERESRHHCISTAGSPATPNESYTTWPCAVLLPNQISKTCPTYGELYDLDSPPPSYDEWETKNFSNAAIPAEVPPPVDKASSSNTFSRFQFEQLYRNLIYFTFYMFYRLKNLI